MIEDKICIRCGCVIPYEPMNFINIHQTNDECIRALRAKVAELQPKPERFAAMRHWLNDDTLTENRLVKDGRDLLQVYDEGMNTHTYDEFMQWQHKWAN